MSRHIMHEWVQQRCFCEVHVSFAVQHLCYQVYYACSILKLAASHTQVFLCNRASENHMTRVQELGRLCRYPGVSSTDTVTLPLVNDSRSTADVQQQLNVALSFACGRQLDWDTCKQIALSLCAAARDIFAFVSFMASTKARSGNPQLLDRLRQLIQRLPDQVIHSPCCLLCTSIRSSA